MAKQKFDQETQVDKSDLFDDARTPGAPLQNDSENLRDDLNALRTQIRRVISGADPGSWTDDPATVFGEDVSLKALHASGLAFDEDKILVAQDGTVVVDQSGHVVRSV